MLLWAAMKAEYGLSDEEFFEAEPSRINALNAAACERAGMEGRSTYRAKDTLRDAETILHEKGTLQHVTKAQHG